MLDEEEEEGDQMYEEGEDEEGDDLQDDGREDDGEEDEEEEEEDVDSQNAQYNDYGSDNLSSSGYNASSNGDAQQMNHMGGYQTNANGVTDIIQDENGMPIDPHVYFQQLYSQSPPLYQNMTMELHQQTLATSAEYA